MRYTSLLLFLLVGPWAMATPLQLTVENPKQLSGTLHLALQPLTPLAAESWQQDGKVQLITAPCLAQRQCQLTLAEVVPGRYAIRLFLDENDNASLETSPAGLPLEAVGFSQNPPLYHGMPSPQQAAFEVTDVALSLSITLMKRDRQP